MAHQDKDIVTNLPRKSITFYTSRTAPACRAVKMVATHLQIPLNEVKMRCYIDTRTDEFCKINPLHTLPVIDDDGYILWESRAIMQYLCNQYAPNSNLYPKDPQKRATVDRLLHFDLKMLGHSVIALHHEFMFPSEFSSSRGERLIAVTDALTLLEIFLINKNYVACDHLTIADISIIANVTLLEIAVEFDLSSYSNIWLWINRLRNELPYYDALTKLAHDELRALIQSVRDAHDEWSLPLSKCAFTPKNCNDDQSFCIEEQRKQYQRLFSNNYSQNNVARIMAAVIPRFKRNSNTKSDYHSNQQQKDNIKGDNPNLENDLSFHSYQSNKSNKSSTPNQNDGHDNPNSVKINNDCNNSSYQLQLNTKRRFSFLTPNSLIDYPNGNDSNDRHIHYYNNQISPDSNSLPSSFSLLSSPSSSLQSSPTMTSFNGQMIGKESTESTSSSYIKRIRLTDEASSGRQCFQLKHVEPSPLLQ